LAVFSKRYAGLWLDTGLTHKRRITVGGVYRTVVGGVAGASCLTDVARVASAKWCRFAVIVGRTKIAERAVLTFAAGAAELIEIAIAVGVTAAGVALLSGLTTVGTAVGNFLETVRVEGTGVAS